MSTEQVSAEEMAESLTGFEEIAIERAFGAEVYDLPPVKTLRALVFVLLKRQGLRDPEAKEQVLAMPLKEVNGHFCEPEEETVPDQPETEAGKDADQPD